MQRRNFLLSSAVGARSGPAVLAQRRNNDRIGVAVIGVGTRGIYLLQEFQKISDVEVRLICDLYDGHLKRAKESCRNTKARVTKDWQEAVSSPDVEVVVIATPDFWHAPMTVAAAQNRKDIYVEKGWCLNLEQAKQTRAAVRDNNVMMQLGHQDNSFPTFHRARDMYREGKIGRVPLVRTYIDRTMLKWPQWKFYGTYSVHEPPADASPETIDWKRFTANTTKRPFDVERFFNWRNWWEYSNGIAGDLMSHSWDSVNMVLEMGIPEACYTQGNLYYWTKAQEVPDMWHVLFDYPKQQLAVTFNCNFHNRHVGELAQYLGRDGTLDVSSRFCRYYRSEWADEDKPNAARRTTGDPDYSFRPEDLTVTTHQQDLVDSVRSRRRPRCHEDRAFEETATIVMSVESFRRGRKVCWDSTKEEVI